MSPVFPLVLEAAIVVPRPFLDQAVRQPYTASRVPRAWPLDRRATWERMRRHVCVRQHRPPPRPEILL
jgi:hypothetical protein